MGMRSNLIANEKSFTMISTFWFKVRHIVLVALSVLGGVTLGAALVGAATTISTNITTAGTLAVTSSSTITGLLSVGGALTANGTLTAVGDSTLASTTATALKVGQTGTRHTGFASGYCTIANVNIAASSTGMVSCSSATGVVSGDRVFVQATSSIPDNFLIQAASTTADTVIQVDLFNTPTTTADGGGDDTGVRSFNFWAVR